jgi:hypothetical protein
LPGMFFRYIFFWSDIPYWRSWRGVLITTLCDKIGQWLATGRWFSPCSPVSSTNKTDHHDITEILLKVALNTINQTNNIATTTGHEWIFSSTKLHLIAHKRYMNNQLSDSGSGVPFVMILLLWIFI